MSNLIDKLNLKPQERRMLVVVAIVVFIAINAYFVFPVFGELGRTQRQIIDTTATLDAYKSEVSKRDIYERDLAALQVKGADIPTEERAGSLMRDVQNLATLNGVNFDRYNPAPRRSGGAETNAFFDEQTLFVSMRSMGQRELISFLHKLSSQESLTRVRTINLRPDAPRQKLSGDITFVRSFQRKPATRAAARAAARGQPAPATNTPPAAAPANTNTTAPKRPWDTNRFNRPIPKPPSRAIPKPAGTNKPPALPSPARPMPRRVIPTPATPTPNP